MDVTELQANANKRLPVCVEVCKVIERYADEVQGIQTRREEA